jgi:DNA polymerase III alpha subunit
MARAFVLRYRGEQEVTFLHPSLEPILGSTKGVLIFQEQILRVATEIAGLSWEQADHLRRGMSKFRPNEMEELAAQFLAGCQRSPPVGPGLSESQAQALWDLIVPFSGYGFNQGHATAYAEVSFRSAYVKAHYPAAFLCARLANWGGFHHPAMYMAEAVRLGIDVRGPHVNHSERAFDLRWENEQPVLWMGLSWVRGLRQASIASIVAERRARPFRGLRDLMSRVDLQVNEVVNLVRCGALDGLGSGRSALLADLSDVQRAGSALQMTLGIEERRVVSESLVQQVAWEQDVLGYPVSVITCPLLLVQDRLRGCVALADLDRTLGRMASVGGVRLPGWTGGRGFHLWDGERWVVAKQGKEEKAPRPWVPLQLRGRWTADEWGTCSFHVNTVRELRIGG